MGKFILLISLLGISLLFLFGLIMPDNPIMWLSSVSLSFALIRLSMIVVLVSLLVTHPPRNIILRILVASFAIGLGSWALWGFYFYSIMPMDLLSILLFSISTSLIVLENKRIAIEPISDHDRIQEARKARTASYAQFNLKNGA